MEFSYEITIDEYVAGQKLYRKLASGSAVARNSALWILLGLLFFIMARREPVFGWPAFLLSCVGIYWVYCGVLSFYPGRYYRRAYGKSGLAGKLYRATLNAQGLQVAGDDCGWQALWKAVQVKGEDGMVFVVFAANTIFIFGKKYLTPEQQDELRGLAGLEGPFTRCARDQVKIKCGGFSRSQDPPTP